MGDGGRGGEWGWDPPRPWSRACERGCGRQGLGLTHIKFFPAEANGGAKALKALAGPYGHTGLRWMPTGGGSVENMQGYLSQPQVFAVGGSWLVPADALKARDYAAIEALARAAVAMSRRV